MRKILILMGRYLPGYKDGGPVRTIINLTDALGDEYDFHIACLDRDHGDDKPYDDIKYKEWNVVGKAKVWYVEPGKFSFSIIRKLARDVDLIYTCGFYDDYGYKTLILNRFGLLFGKPVVVASMGTFSEGALSQKSAKKMLFINLCKTMGLFKKIKWSVTSPIELRDVQKYIGKSAECIIAEDMPRTNVPGRHGGGDINPNEVLRVVFLSRISPKKNLLGAIKCLQSVKSDIEFTIFGPKEDIKYWKICEAELKELPDNVNWKYGGDVASDKVQEELSMHDVFLFPTFGENYGHVIFEALSVGCIPVISDQTPWNWLADIDAGFILEADNNYLVFSQAIESLAQMPASEREMISEHAVLAARDKAKQATIETGYRNVFG